VIVFEYDSDIGNKTPKALANEVSEASGDEYNESPGVFTPEGTADRDAT
jgi:hypothetical protein